MSYEALSRLPDPTTVPAGPGFVSQQIIDKSPGMVHNLNHGGSVSVKFAGNYWEINIAYPQLTVAEANTIFPFLYSLQGAFTNFYVQLPTYVQPQTGAWSTGTDALIAKGEITVVQPNQISIPLWSTRGGDLSIGDMIKFTNLNKIYMIVGKSLNADTVTLTLNCDISDTVAIATAGLEPNDLKFRVRVRSEVPSPTLTADGLYEGFSLALRENII